MASASAIICARDKRDTAAFPRKQPYPWLRGRFWPQNAKAPHRSYLVVRTCGPRLRSAGYMLMSCAPILLVQNGVHKKTRLRRGSFQQFRRRRSVLLPGGGGITENTLAAAFTGRVEPRAETARRVRREGTSLDVSTQGRPRPSPPHPCPPPPSGAARRLTRSLSPRGRTVPRLTVSPRRLVS
jgi:hypothetical protein